MAGGAGTDLVTGVLDMDMIIQEGVTDRLTGLGLNDITVRAEFVVGQDNNFWHLKLQGVNGFSGQGLLDGLIHPFSGEGLAGIVQFFGETMNFIPAIFF